MQFGFFYKVQQTYVICQLFHIAVLCNFVISVNCDFVASPSWESENRIIPKFLWSRIQMMKMKEMVRRPVQMFRPGHSPFHQHLLDPQLRPKKDRHLQNSLRLRRKNK